MTVNKFFGLGTLEESLEKHGMIACKYFSREGFEHRYMFLFYDVDTKSYQTESFSDAEINDFMLTMINKPDQDSLLSSLGLTLGEWLESNPLQKVVDLLFHFTHNDIFSTCYFPNLLDKNEVWEHVRVLEERFEKQMMNNITSVVEAKETAIKAMHNELNTLLLNFVDSSSYDIYEEANICFGDYEYLNEIKFIKAPKQIIFGTILTNRCEYCDCEECNPETKSYTLDELPYELKLKITPAIIKLYTEE